MPNIPVTRPAGKALGESLKKERYVFINALRGIAALLVVVFHMQIHTFYTEDTIPQGSFTWWFVYGFFDLGKYAVGVFFMVSGFLIPATLRGSSASLRKFAIHRFFRLYPAYWFSIAFFFLIYKISGEPTSVAPSVLVANLTMLQKFVGRPDIIGVFWTLQIELIFYLLCAALFAVKKLDNQWGILLTLTPLGLLAAAARYVTHKPIPVAILIALMLMFLGDTLRTHFDGKTPNDQVVKSLALVLISIIPICYLGYREEFTRYLVTYFAAVGTFYVSFLGASKFDANEFFCRIWNFLGDISYGVYLTGAVLQVAVTNLFYRQYGMPAVSMALLLSLVIGLSYLVYRFVEQPFIRLGRTLSTPKPPAPPAQA